jgi:glutaredoxin 3
MAWKIVSRPDCKWCDRAKSHLAVRAIEFEELRLATREEQLAFKEQTQLGAFPQIWDGDKHVGGYDNLKAYLA